MVRISLRWLGGFLIAKGYAHDNSIFTDPDLVQALCHATAGVCGLISEGWFYIERKRGRKKDVDCNP